MIVWKNIDAPSKIISLQLPWVKLRFDNAFMNGKYYISEEVWEVFGRNFKLQFNFCFKDGHTKTVNLNSNTRQV